MQPEKVSQSANVSSRWRKVRGEQSTRFLLCLIFNAALGEEKPHADWAEGAITLVSRGMVDGTTREFAPSTFTVEKVSRTLNNAVQHVL